jgi:hypothetical protein
MRDVDAVRVACAALQAREEGQVSFSLNDPGGRTAASFFFRRAALLLW